MKRFQITLLILIIFTAFILRFYKLGINPPGLYWDEAVFGYDAYSILKTGKDHHGVTLPLFFESFGDWKLPGYHYLLVLSIAVFGLNEFAVRFPSAFFGSLTIIVFFFIVKKLTKNIRLSLFCTFFLAISPWHIQFSRAGFESTVGLFFVTSAVYFFLFLIDDRKTKPRSAFFLPAIALATAGLFTLSMYFYNAYRIFTPLFVISLLLIYLEVVKKIAAKLILPALLALILIFPIIIFTISKEGRSRAISQSAFSYAGFETNRIDYDQKSKKPLRFLSKYWYWPFYFSYLAFNTYIDHFSPSFLFFKGDQIGRHSQVDMGQIYLFEGILLIVSIIAFKKLNAQTKKIMFSWLILAPIPAIIVTPSPHAYRTLQIAIPLAFFSGFGAYLIFSQKKLLLVKIIMIVIIGYSFLTYLHLLLIHYPKKFAADWQDGYKAMVAQVQKYQDQFNKVYVTNINQVPYIYLLFYQKYDPQKFINSGGTRDAFDKYVFISDDVNIYDKALPAGWQGRILYVAPSWKKVDGNFLAAVDDSVGRHIYTLWEVNGQN